MVKSLKDYRNNELIEEIESRKDASGDKYTVVAAYSANAFIIFFVGVVIGIGIFGIARWGGNSVDRDTLNEVCTELAGEESVYSSGESTSDVIVCKPYIAQEETIINDEKIKLVGYNNTSYLPKMKQYPNTFEAQDSEPLFICNYVCIVPNGGNYGGGSGNPVEKSVCDNLKLKANEDCYLDNGQFRWYVKEE